jgi:transposase-like protein
MPNRPCPRCHKTGRFLKDSSSIALVDYYRCDHCGEVWVLDRSDPTKPPRSVTQPKREPDDLV